MAFREPIIGGGGELVRERMRSGNYVAGTSGWQITRDGDAEFNDVTLRGSLLAKDGNSEIELTNDPVPTLRVNPDVTVYEDGFLNGNDGGFGDVGALVLQSPYHATSTETAVLTLSSHGIDSGALAAAEIAAERQAGPIFAADPIWTDLNLAAGYSALGTGFDPQWRWLTPTTVQMRGNIKKGTGAGGVGANGFANGNQPMAVGSELPAAIQPLQVVNASCPCQARSTNFGVCRMQINTNGTVTFVTSAAHDPGWVELNVIYDVS